MFGHPQHSVVVLGGEPAPGLQSFQFSVSSVLQLVPSQVDHHHVAHILRIGVDSILHVGAVAVGGLALGSQVLCWPSLAGVADVVDDKQDLAVILLVQHQQSQLPPGPQHSVRVLLFVPLD